MCVCVGLEIGVLKMCVSASHKRSKNPLSQLLRLYMCTSNLLMFRFRYCNMLLIFYDIAGVLWTHTTHYAFNINV